MKKELKRILCAALAAAADVSLEFFIHLSSSSLL